MRFFIFYGDMVKGGLFRPFLWKMKITRRFSDIEEKFHDLCVEVLEGLALCLYDLEYNPRNGLLRLFIFDPLTESALLDDCARVDRALTPYLEELEWVPDRLTLEVSSPGMYRSLKTHDHFKMAKNKGVKVFFPKSTDFGELGLESKEKKKILSQGQIVGRLVEVKEDRIILEYEDIRLPFEFSVIKKACLCDEL